MDEAAGPGEAEEVLIRFPFFVLFSAASRSLISVLDTPIMCRMVSVNRANSGLSGGFSMGLE